MVRHIRGVERELVAHKLPKKLVDRLRKEAARRGVPMTLVVTEALCDRYRLSVEKFYG